MQNLKNVNKKQNTNVTKYKQNTKFEKCKISKCKFDEMKIKNKIQM